MLWVYSVAQKRFVQKALRQQEAEGAEDVKGGCNDLIYLVVSALHNGAHRGYSVVALECTMRSDHYKSVSLSYNHLLVDCLDLRSVERFGSVVMANVAVERVTETTSICLN